MHRNYTRTPLLAALLFLVVLTAVSADGIHVDLPARPGGVVTVSLTEGEWVDAVEVELSEGERSVCATWAFRLPGSNRESGTWIALLGVPSWVRPGTFTVTAHSYRVKGVDFGSYAVRTRSHRIEIGEREFASERIPLSGAMSTLRRDDSEQRRDETIELTELLRRTDVEALHSTGRFSPPTTSQRRTSSFGDRRTFLYADGNESAAIHHGVDFGAPTGTPVLAPAGARVVMAKARIITGNTVVLEHLPGVYTLYYHLDRIDVTVGEVVRPGVQIGTVGSTGLVTGPHLHWEMRVAAVAVDPEPYLDRPILDIPGESGNIGPH